MYKGRKSDMMEILAGAGAGMYTLFQFAKFAENTATTHDLEMMPQFNMFAIGALSKLNCLNKFAAMWDLQADP